MWKILLLLSLLQSGSSLNPKNVTTNRPTKDVISNSTKIESKNVTEETIEATGSQRLDVKRKPTYPLHDDGIKRKHVISDEHHYARRQPNFKTDGKRNEGILENTIGDEEPSRRPVIFLMSDDVIRQKPTEAYQEIDHERGHDGHDGDDDDDDERRHYDVPRDREGDSRTYDGHRGSEDHRPGGPQEYDSPPPPDFYMEDFYPESYPDTTCATGLEGYDSTTDEYVRNGQNGEEQKSEDRFVSKRTLACRRIKNSEDLPEFDYGRLKGLTGQRRRAWVRCEVVKMAECSVVGNYKKSAEDPVRRNNQGSGRYDGNGRPPYEGPQEERGDDLQHNNDRRHGPETGQRGSSQYSANGRPYEIPDPTREGSYDGNRRPYDGPEEGLQYGNGRVHEDRQSHRDNEDGPFSGHEVPYRGSVQYSDDDGGPAHQRPEVEIRGSVQYADEGLNEIPEEGVADRNSLHHAGVNRDHHYSGGEENRLLRKATESKKAYAKKGHIARRDNPFDPYLQRSQNGNRRLRNPGSNEEHRFGDRPLEVSSNGRRHPGRFRNTRGRIDNRRNDRFTERHFRFNEDHRLPSSFGGRHEDDGRDRHFQEATPHSNRKFFKDGPRNFPLGTPLTLEGDHQIEPPVPRHNHPVHGPLGKIPNEHHHHHHQESHLDPKELPASHPRRRSKSPSSANELLIHNRGLERFFERITENGKQTKGTHQSPRASSRDSLRRRHNEAPIDLNREQSEADGRFGEEFDSRPRHSSAETSRFESSPGYHRRRPPRHGFSQGHSNNGRHSGTDLQFSFAAHPKDVPSFKGPSEFDPSKDFAAFEEYLENEIFSKPLIGRN